MPAMSDRINLKKQLLAVGIGGILGACLRYSVSLLFMEISGFPFATLTVNVIGCFVLSFLSNSEQIKNLLPPHFLTALTTGLIGAFTTFSTFAVETVELMAINVTLAFVYVLLSVIGGLIFCYLGVKLAQKRRETA